MQTLNRYAVMTACALFGLLAGAVPAIATEQACSGSVVISHDRTIEDDLLASGSSIQMQGRVNGDATLAGANITVAGSVRDDILAAGANVNVTGPVGDDLRAVGGTVTVNAPVTDNVDLAGGTVILQSAASVGRDANLAGGTVEVQSRIRRNLSLAAGEARLASEVGGSVQAHVDHLTLLPGAVVHGDLAVFGPNPPEISPQAKVLGSTTFHKTVGGQQGNGSSGGAGWVGWWLIQFLALFLLGLVVLALSPLWVEHVAETVVRRTGLSLLIGSLCLLLVPPASLLMALTLVGIPPALLLTAAYGAVLLTAGAFVAYPVGERLLRQHRRPKASSWARLALGALVVSFLASLPWIGWLMGLIVLIVGSGAVLLECREFLLRLRAEGLA